MRHRSPLLLLLALLAPALASAQSTPVQIVRFVGTPADSADRAAFTQAFETAFAADTLATEQMVDGVWSPGLSVTNPFVRVDVSASELTWNLDLSVRLPPEIRVPIPRHRRQDPLRFRRSTLRASRGLVFAVAGLSPTDVRRSVTPAAVRYEVYFADTKRVVVPSSRLPGGAYDFPYEDAGRIVARAALEVMLRATGMLAADERVALEPATRVQP